MQHVITHHTSANMPQPQAPAHAGRVLLWLRCRHSDGGRTSQVLYPHQVAAIARQCAANPTVLEIGVYQDDEPLAVWQRAAGELSERQALDGMALLLPVGEGQ